MATPRFTYLNIYNSSAGLKILLDKRPNGEIALVSKGSGIFSCRREKKISYLPWLPIRKKFYLYKSVGVRYAEVRKKT